MDRVPTISGNTNLIDILDRVLDKGLVIAGDISIALANVELLTIRIRLLICSVDKAEQIGLNWWKHDPNLTAPARTGIPGSKSLPAMPPASVRESIKTSRTTKAARPKRAR
jgi:Gas vesicle protein